MFRQVQGFSNRAPAKQVERMLNDRLPRGYIDGLILSNDTTDATNDIGISAGVCRSTSNRVSGAFSTLNRDQIDLEIPVAIIKQLDVAWAPENYEPDGFSGGGRSGGRSSSSISNTGWHVFAIGAREVPTDILLHDGADPGSILPGGYTAWRRIGAVIRSGAALLTFTQVGDTFLFSVAQADVTVTNLGATATLYTLTVPTGVKVDALIRASASHGTAFTLAISSPDESDQSASTTFGDVADPSTALRYMNKQVRTNTSGQIRARSNASSTSLNVGTYGWVDPRGRG